MEIDKKDDWRLNDQELYLKDKILQKKIFVPPSEEKDHTHCSFCWAKFSENSTDLHEGYTAEEGRYWICLECFHDFKDRFNWTLKNN